MTFDGCDFSDHDLKEFDLTNANLSQAKFKNCVLPLKLNSANLSGVDLSGHGEKKKK